MDRGGHTTVKASTGKLFTQNANYSHQPSRLRDGMQQGVKYLPDILTRARGREGTQLTLSVFQGQWRKLILQGLHKVNPK